jgi:hypothetical protein
LSVYIDLKPFYLALKAIESYHKPSARFFEKGKNAQICLATYNSEACALVFLPRLKDTPNTIFSWEKRKL